MRPEEIERQSFAIIEQELEEMGRTLPKSLAPVIMRCIHTSADFSYADTLVFSEGVVDQAVALIKSGVTVVTDTNMALAGIRRGLLAQCGGRAVCFMAEEDVALEAKERNVTRAVVSMERAMRLPEPVLFAIGNAPTALMTLHEKMAQGTYHPALVIGVPVGFVHVETAKELILGDPAPYIINRGRKGGSNIAAAIVNALLLRTADV